jgi:hypothetical protein
MHVVLAILGIAIAFGLGYAFRGFIHRELIKAGGELQLLVGRLEQYLTADEAKLKAFIKAEIVRLRAKL